MHKYFYFFLLASCCGYAFWRGRGDVRIAAAVCLLATAVTNLVLHSPLDSHRQLETGVLAIDVLVFGAFVWLALSSQRFWPLWVAGLQLTSLLAHLARVSGIDLLPVAYAAAERFWSYPILIIIAVGAARQHRRLMDERDLSAPA